MNTKEIIKNVLIVWVIGMIAIALGVGIALYIIHNIEKEGTKPRKSEYVCASIGVYASSPYSGRTYCDNGKDHYYVYTTKDGEVIINEEKID